MRTYVQFPHNPLASQWGVGYNGVTSGYRSEGAMDPEEAYRVMDLKALRCFWAVGKRGTLTGASIELGISEPAVSKRVRALEGYLGTKLYESRGGKVRLTPAGHKVWEMSVELFDRLGEFERGMAQEGIMGSLTIAAEVPVQLYLLPPVVDKYRRLFPNVTLRLIARPVSQTVELVRQNEVDIGIVASGEFPEGLVFHPWRAFEAYLILPRGHPVAARAKQDFKSLLNPQTIIRYPMIVGEAEEAEHHRLREGLANLGLPLKVAFEVSDFEAVKRYVSLGLGVAVVSGICLTEDDQTRLEIVKIPPDYGGQTTYGVLIRERKYVDAALKGVLTLLEVSIG
ncbi:MAG: LysR family transcriptional regulator [Dehalococcoidia bacterium]|nr:LysR family transcriptional regulator [Dehalococcoidia bacterium]